MKRFIVLFAVALLLASALPALAAPDVIFEPESVFFVKNRSLDKQLVTSVDVSLSDNTEIKAIRFGENNAVSCDFTGATMLVLSSDISGGKAKLTFHGDISADPFFFQPVRVRLYSDATALIEITSEDLEVRFGSVYDMTFDTVETLAAGEPVDITIKVTFDNNVTGEEDLILPLKSLTLVDDPDPADLGLKITPNAATSTIRITSSAAKLGTAIYYVKAESESGSIDNTGFEITVAEHTVSFSTGNVLAMATEDVDYNVSIIKKPASTPLASFDIVMTLFDDYDPTFETVSSDTGRLTWNGLTFDLDAVANSLRIYGAAEDEWDCEFMLQGWLKGGDRLEEPDFESEELGVTTYVFGPGEALDVDAATITDPDGNNLFRMKLDVRNTITIPLASNVQDDIAAVTVITPSKTVVQIRDAAIEPMPALSRGAAKNLVINYMPTEKGDHMFEVLYAQDDTPYYEDLIIGAGDYSSGSSGCNAGFAAFAILSLAALGIRRKK